MDRAARRWAAAVAASHPQAVRIGYFGSYARGDWGVGSDLDLVMVVEQSELPFERRASQWDLTELPVPAELVVYTVEEWDRLARRGRFGDALHRETRWVYVRPSPPESGAGPRTP